MIEGRLSYLCSSLQFNHTEDALRCIARSFSCSVYCSQAFAAISETLYVTQYECSYVGNVPLAKGYGLQPVYHVRWCNSPAGRRLQSLFSESRSIMPAIPGED